VAAVLLALVGCGNHQVPTKVTGTTQDSHAWFPITSGVHAIGAPTLDGAMACASCHEASASSFKQFNCVGCHNHEQTVTDSFHTGIKDYVYASPQCLSCHPSGGKAPFSHDGITNNCAQCHDVGARFAALPVTGFTHAPMNGNDCASCHNTTDWKTATGAPQGKSRDPNADVVVNALIPTYSGTLITIVTPRTEQLPMSMDHASTDISQAAMSACANCHSNTSTGSYYPGYLHVSLATLGKTDHTITQPQACASCHSDAIPVGFVGPISTNRTPASGEMKHDAVAWANGKPTTTAIVSTECGVCHASPSGGSSGGSNGGWATTGKAGGVAAYHASLTAAGMPQPSSCIDCHANSMAVPGFTHPQTNGADCASCHTTTDWKTTGVPQGKSRDPKAQVVVNALIPTYSGTSIASVAPRAEQLPMSMDHASTDVSQAAMSACSNCHSNTSTGGYYPGYLHASLATLAKTNHTITQPQACASCHSDAIPVGFVGPIATSRTPASGEMKHDAVAWANGKPTTTAIVSTECGVCHTSPSGGSNESWATTGKAGGVAAYHGPLAAAGLQQPSSCIDCHANSTPAGTTNSTTLTSAPTGSSTGIPVATTAQFNHADINVSGHDCNFCHTQNGPSTQAGVQGKEWAQAKFHVNFTSTANPLVLNATTGRCSTCHFAEKPGAAYTGYDHSALTNTSGSEDCATCHTFPGTGTTTAPNWLGAAGTPATITVGAFAIPQPPATSATTQAGISNLPHPTVAAGTSCATCHGTGGGYKQALGYDHQSTLMSSNCNACHEAGSNLVATVWNGATSQASGAGDTRPFSIVGLVPSTSGNTRALTQDYNHFFALDCSECHQIPTGNGLVTTGAAYKSAWKFNHSQGKMRNACNMCHGSPNNLPGDN
jgi:hypothetical protein